MLLVWGTPPPPPKRFQNRAHNYRIIRQIKHLSHYWLIQPIIKSTSEMFPFLIFEKDQRQVLLTPWFEYFIITLLSTDFYQNTNQLDGLSSKYLSTWRMDVLSVTDGYTNLCLYLSLGAPPIWGPVWTPTLHTLFDGPVDRVYKCIF